MDLAEEPNIDDYSAYDISFMDFTKSLVEKQQKVIHAYNVQLGKSRKCSVRVWDWMSAHHKMHTGGVLLRGFCYLRGGGKDWLCLV